MVIHAGAIGCSAEVDLFVAIGRAFGLCRHARLAGTRKRVAGRHILRSGTRADAGHGKAILASYLVSSRFATLRATAIAAVQAATHVGSAVVLALLAIPLVTRTLGGVGRAPSLEFLSRGLLMVIGLWLVIRAFRGPNHQHREGLAVGFVAGLVPCPLTLFAMFYALGRGVPEAGLTFALAMMLGVAATLCAVAILTVLARSFVERVITRHGTSLRTFGRVLDGLAGGLLIALGGYELWW